MLQTARQVKSLATMFYPWVRTAGWQAAWTWSAYRMGGALGWRQPFLCIKPRQTGVPLLARAGSSSDMLVFRQIFVEEEYACLRDMPAPRVILDLGANVGYSSAYLLSCFPNAKLVAVEPDPGNFEMCRKNLASFGERVTLVRGAVWPTRASLAISRAFGDGLEWATAVVEPSGLADDATVDGWDIPSLLALSGETQIDLMKCDIEGSELRLFGAGAEEWLSKVGNICIELHGEACKSIFLRALKGYRYDLGTSGELTICRNLRRA